MSLILRINNYCPAFVRKPINRVRKSPLGRKMASGAFWSLVGSVSSRFFMVIAGIIVARILGRFAFGQYSVILSTVNSFIVFTNFGIAMTATKYVAEFRDTDKERTGRILGLSYLFTMCSGVAVTIILLIFAPMVCEHMMDSPELIHELRLGVLFLIIAAVSGAQHGALVGFQEFKVLAITNILAGLLIIPFRAGGAYLGGLSGSVVGFGLSLVMILLINRYFILRITRKNGIAISYRNALRELPILWKFSLPAVLTGVLVTPVYWICYLMLAKSANGFNEVAILDAARQFQLMVLFIPATISQVILPLLVRAGANQDQRQYTNVIKYNLILNFSIALLIALPMIVLSPWIMGAYGPGFSEGVPTLCLLALTAIVIAINNVVGQILASKEKLWVGFFMNLLWAVTFLAGCHIAISRGHGAFGIAFALMIAYALHTCWQGAYLLFIKSTLKTS